jgi:hypothetical protein
MKILSIIKSAAARSLKLWKVVVIVWFISLLLVCMIALPVRGVLNSGLGKSMITEELRGGINAEVFSDLGTTFQSLVSFLSSGMLMAVLAGILLNAFLTGGLFSGLRRSSEKFTVTEFFRNSAMNFWSFLVILLIISLILVILSIIVIVIPLTIVSNIDGPTEGIIIKTLLITFTIFFFLSAGLLLVADYARAWQVSDKKNRYFRAIGFGFRQTAISFFTSYPLMVILLVFQILYGWMVLSVLTGLAPSTGLGVFILFLISQLMVYLRLMLKLVRYGSVTALLEERL